MKVQEKINKMENCRGKNHDLLEFRSWLTRALPQHIQLKKIQVAGTNGKGSTSIWLRDLLMKKGYKVGVFTSPHLVHHTERIRVNEKCISLMDWERIYDQYEELFESNKMTMFEMDLWMAMAYFLEKKVDYCIIEAGMGGRLDATTALDYKACLITNVGLDHTEYLGDTVEQIAYEKSGIFKPGIPALTTEMKPECQKVMELVADYMKTPLCFIDCQQTDVLRWNGMTFYVKPPLYQAKNLALALETLNVLNIKLEEKEIQKVIDHFHWEGRFMVLQKNPLILLDGAHNVHGIKALIPSLSDFHGNIYFSVLKEKDAPHMIELLQTISKNITLVEISSARLYPLEKLGLPIINMDELIKRLHHESKDCLLCGSLYYVGEVLEKWNKKND